MKAILNEYKNKVVLVTGHTGFKGAWLCSVLKEAGADIVGYALKPPTEPNLFELAKVREGMVSIEGDIRNREQLNEVFCKYRPEYVFHLAAQPIVRESYDNPVYTYETNVMGTVNLMDCIRENKCVRSVINVTTDKVYENKEWEWAYRETDILNGYDPYSNSKSCSELITDSYRKCFFRERDIRVSTMRAGNVIGGGDFAKDRIIPDCVRAAISGKSITVRNPYSIRPYQHVLEPLSAYLAVAAEQRTNPELEGCYNIGPDECDCITTGELVSLFCRCWGEGLSWNSQYEGGPHEAGCLKLDCSKLRMKLHWNPRWHIGEALERTVNWAKKYRDGLAVKEELERQITDYFRIDSF